jgi:hybrid cluster-associated redox disulfide protein
MPLPPPLLRYLHARVHQCLQERRVWLPDLRQELSELSAHSAEANRLLQQAQSNANQLERAWEHLQAPRFLPEMTMEAVLLRHPGAARVLARHGLPGCGGCAVRFDETLGEAALAYGLHLSELLIELDALPGMPGSPRTASTVL